MILYFSGFVKSWQLHKNKFLTVQPEPSLLLNPSLFIRTHIIIEILCIAIDGELLALLLLWNKWLIHCDLCLVWLALMTHSVTNTMASHNIYAKYVPLKATRKVLGFVYLIICHWMHSLLMGNCKENLVFEIPYNNNYSRQYHNASQNVIFQPIFS